MDLSKETLPALVRNAQRAIEVAGSFEEVKQIRDEAEALRKYAQSIDAGLEAQNHCAEVKLRAERKMGEEVNKIELSKGGRPGKNPLHDVTGFSHKDLGFNRTQTQRWRKIADLSEERFEQYLQDTKDAASGEITTAGCLRLYEVARREEMPRVREMQRIEDTLSGHYAVFYADPPWQYSNAGFNGSAESHYNTMATDEICEMPVDDYTGENAVLFLWATNPLLKDGLKVLESWGFRYVTNWVWVKDSKGYYGKGGVSFGFYNHGRHELLLLGVKGSFLPEGNLPNSVIEAPKAEHSRKPECVYEMIEKLYPSSRRVELFQRGTRDGWEGFGNEAG